MLILNSQSFSCKEKLLNKILLTQKRNPAFSHLALDNLLLLFSSPVVSNSLQPHGLQHIRPPCPSVPPEFTQIHIDWMGDATQPSHPLLSHSPPAFNLSSIRVFSNKTDLHIRWQSFGASASESVLLMSFHGWFPLGLTGLRAVQGALRSLLQNHSSKASILWCSAFFMVQLSHPYILLKKP